MERIDEGQIRGWLIEAGKSEKTIGPVRERIIVAARFIDEHVRSSASDRRQFLRGIDFSRTVLVIRSLPNKVYVQYVGGQKGRWFTDTGLTPESVGLFAGSERRRKLFRPGGSVTALRSSAASIKDTWSVKSLFGSVDPTQSRDQKTPVRGVATGRGGTQYLVADPTRMIEL